MTTGLKNFIEQKIELIDANDFATLYRQAHRFFDEDDAGELVPELTQLLFAAGIDPLIHMKFIPKYYLAGTEIKHFYVPEHIVNISEFAFSHCFHLTRLVLPPSIGIDAGAFLNCVALKQITFKGKVPRLAHGAFRWCGGVKDIYYPGTIREYTMISHAGKLEESINLESTIHCSDGDILGKDVIS